MVSLRLVVGAVVLHVELGKQPEPSHDTEPPPQLAGGQGQVLEVWPEPAFGFQR